MKPTRITATVARKRMERFEKKHSPRKQVEANLKKLFKSITKELEAFLKAAEKTPLKNTRGI